MNTDNQTKNFDKALNDYKAAVDSVDIDEICKNLKARGFTDKEIETCVNIHRAVKDLLEIV